MLFTPEFIQLKETVELNEEQKQKTTNILQTIYGNNSSITQLTNDNEPACKAQFQALLQYIIKLHDKNYHIFAVYLANIENSIKKETCISLKEMHYIQAKILLENSLYFLIDKAEEVDPISLNSYVVDQCLPGAFTNLLDILFEIQDNIFTQIKYFTVRQLAINYTRAHFTYLAGDETHVVTPLINTVALEYGFNLRSDPLAKELTEDEIQAFKDYLQKEITPSLLITTLSTQVFPDKISTADKDYKELLNNLQKKVQQLGLDYRRVLESAYDYEENEDSSIVTYASNKEKNQIKIALLVQLFHKKKYITRSGFIPNHRPNDIYLDCFSVFVRFDSINKQFSCLTVNESLSLITLLKNRPAFAHFLAPLVGSLFASSPLSDKNMGIFLTSLSSMEFDQYGWLFSLLLKPGFEKNAIALCTAYPGFLTDVLNEEKNYHALHFIAEQGNLEVLQYLMAASPPLSHRQMQEALYLAAVKGHTNLIEFLLKQNNASISTNDDDYTLIHMAAYYGKSELLTFLLSKYPSMINHACKQGNLTALHFAAMAGQSEIVKLLCDHGASPAARTVHGLSPFVVAAENQYLSIVRYLSEQQQEDINQFNPTTGATVLYTACKMNNLPMVEFLLDKGADLSLGTNEGSPLTMAMKNANEAMVYKIIDKMNAAQLAKALQLLITNNWVNTIRRLLKEKKISPDAYLNSANEEPITLLEHAICCGRKSIVSLLIEHQVDIGQNDLENNIPEVLQLAIMEEQYAIYNMLYFYLAKTAKKVFIDLSIYAFDCAEEYGQEEVIPKIISYFPPLDEIADKNEDTTYLHYLVLRDDPSLLEACFKYQNVKINLDKKNVHGQTAFDLALTHQFYDVAILLLAYGHPLDIKQLSSEQWHNLIIRAIYLKSDLLTPLLSHLKFDEELNKRGHTAIDYALYADNLQAVKYIVKHSLCSISIKILNQKEDINTALHWLQKNIHQTHTLNSAGFFQKVQKRKSTESTEEINETKIHKPG